VSNSAKILVVMQDLFFGVKITDAAKRLGVKAEFIKTADQLLEQLGESPIVVVIDLSFQAIGPIELIRKIRANPAQCSVRIVAFLSHVHKDLMQQAQEAGCDIVVPRSTFSQDLNPILQESLAALA
jgi:CheY-like chemotaxis protein